MLYGFLVSLFVLCSILMIVVILMQASKGGGLAGSFGGMGSSGGILGARGASSFLQKTTVGLAVTYALLCLVISIMSTQTESINSKTQQKLLDQQQTTSPLTAPPAVESPVQEQPAQTPADDSQNDNNSDN